MGSARSRAISTTGSTPASAPRRLRRTTSAHTGRTTAKHAKAPRPPARSTKPDAAIEPTASPAIVTPSSRPKTRASASGLAIRCKSVRPATSSVVRPTPATARSTKADERHRHGDPEHAARAERGVQVARRPTAVVEDGDGEDDVEDVERADPERLDPEQPDERPGSALFGDGAGAGERRGEQVAARLRARGRAAEGSDEER